MKKILKTMIIPLGLLALASCNNATSTTNTSIPQDNSSTSVGKQDDTITLKVDSKMYDGNAIFATATSTSGRTPTIEYKLESEDDSEYSTTAPKTAGRYICRATLSETSGYNAVEKTVKFKINMDFLPEEYKEYENTNAYRKVSNAKEFLDALYDAKYTYSTTATDVIKSEGYQSIAATTVRKNNANWTKFITKGLYLKEGDEYIKIPSNTPWDENDTTYTKSLSYYEDDAYSLVSYTQDLTKEGTIKVIEITNDLDLGYNKIKDLGANTSTYEDWDKDKKMFQSSTKFFKDPDLKASGISQIKVQNISNLLIYSKNGAKLTHCGFNVLSCKDVSFRNIDMDELWMWEDSTTTDLSGIGDYDAAKWAYFKISHSENIWIDHCSFGKSFDGQIDYSNPVCNSFGTLFRAPYGFTGQNSLYVTYCDFHAGSTDKDGYIYKMMKRIEDEYQIYKADPTGYTKTDITARYYFNKRDSGMTFEDIMYTYAIPQKKAFLWADSGDDYRYNKHLFAVLANCTLKNIEDRIPKVRGGMAYVYNVLVDNTEYYPYAVKYGNTSQGVLSGLDASVYLESVEYKGCKQYLKNNDSNQPGKNYPTVNGGYMIKNSIFGDKKGSSTDATNPFASLVEKPEKLSTSYFAFKVNGEKTTLTTPPIEIEAYDLMTNGSLVPYFKLNVSGAI